MCNPFLADHKELASPDTPGGAIETKIQTNTFTNLRNLHAQHTTRLPRSFTCTYIGLENFIVENEKLQ